MKQGYKGGVEWSKDTDSVTGVEVIRLSRYKGDHHHFYFTNPGWYDNSKKFL